MKHPWSRKVTAFVRNRRSLAAMTQLAAGTSIRATAKRTRVSERTIRRWLEDSAFASEVLSLRAKMFQRAVGVLADGATRAARALVKLLASSSTAAPLGTARAMLELGPRLRESTELEQRIRALEERRAPAPALEQRRVPAPAPSKNGLHRNGVHRNGTPSAN